MTSQILSFLNGTNADFISQLYARYAENPASVDPDWRAFFGSLKEDAQSILHELRGASWAPQPRANGHDSAPQHALRSASGGPTPPPTVTSGEPAAKETGLSQQALLDSVRAIMLIRATRVRGHLQARLDPLGLAPVPQHPELDPRSYGFTEADFDRPIYIDGMLGLQTATIREILGILQRTYCGTIGVEFMHIQDPEQKFWVQERVESSQNQPSLSKDEKRAALERLTAAEDFEKFLQIKFPGTKRFGLEGGEAMVPAIEKIIAAASTQDLQQVVIGMAHRGRLNMLTNLLGKPFTAMFAEFQGAPAYPDSVQGSGDVKYHLGTSTNRDFHGKTIHLSLNANPSHLEFVNPVVVGRVRAKQQAVSGPVITDEARRQVVALLIHGDAAFAGQGIVAETLMLSQLKGYRTGGTIHFVINNQVGFTTSPQYSRSGVYCTDVAKMIQSPIFHVNGDDVEAVLHVAQMAAEFRQKFLKDVVIDMVCYRRHGHNESDEPAFTQPLMYQRIKAQPTTRDLYKKKLVADGSLTLAESDKINSDFMARLEQDFKASASYKPSRAEWLEGRWVGFQMASGEERGGDTGVDLKSLREIGYGLTRIPKGFNINPKIAKQLEAKTAMMDTGVGIDWSTGEALAFGALVTEGVPVRLSGQDSGRGTFSQRHSVLYDQVNEQRYIPLNNLRPDQAAFEVHDSPLSELAVMGFDYGYSLAEPNVLVCWEGQFGDFANGAQVMIDQFITQAEAKWLRMSGLVLMLPHGYEGQGPEHSSARLERFLQLCGEDNLQVANCSTPANYFHILRRQIRRNFRKPLILMTPKSLLRHKLCVSPLEDFATNSRFHRVLGERSTELVADSKIRRAVLCSGKVYYDLLAAREERKIRDVALIRLEQFYPFPSLPLAKELIRYPLAEVVWCQEEPENMGAWRFLDRKLEAALTDINHKTKRAVYVGRPESASTATGSLAKHNKQQADLIDAAFTIA